MTQNKHDHKSKRVNTYNITEQHLWLARNLGCRFVPLAQKKPLCKFAEKRSHLGDHLKFDHPSRRVWDSSRRTGYGLVPLSPSITKNAGQLIALDVDDPTIVDEIKAQGSRFSWFLNSMTEHNPNTGKRHIFVYVERDCKKPYVMTEPPRKLREGETLEPLFHSHTSIKGNILNKEGKRKEIISLRGTNAYVACATTDHDSKYKWMTKTFSLYAVGVDHVHELMNYIASLTDVPDQYKHIFQRGVHFQAFDVVHQDGSTVISREDVEEAISNTNMLRQVLRRVSPSYNTTYIQKKGHVPALCPFHQDKKPSATLFKNGMIYCHSCQSSYTTYDVIRSLGITPDNELATSLFSKQRFDIGSVWIALLNRTRTEGKRIIYQRNKKYLDAKDYIIVNIKLLQTLLNRELAEQKGWTKKRYRTSAALKVYSLIADGVKGASRSSWVEKFGESTASRMVSFLRMTSLYKKGKDAEIKLPSRKEFETTFKVNRNPVFVRVPKDYLNTANQARNILTLNQLVLHSDATGMVAKSVNYIKKNSPVAMSRSLFRKFVKRQCVRQVAVKLHVHKKTDLQQRFNKKDSNHIPSEVRTLASIRDISTLSSRYTILMKDSESNDKDRFTIHTKPQIITSHIERSMNAVDHNAHAYLSRNYGSTSVKMYRKTVVDKETGLPFAHIVKAVVEGVCRSEDEALQMLC